MGLIFALQLVGILLADVVGVLWLIGKLPDFRPRHVLALLEVVGGVLAALVMRDRWGEMLDTIRRNKLRTVLTAVSVAWGIFVMIVLLGLGHGLNNGVRESFRRQATNAIFMNANKTSIPNAGYGIGRRITFDNRDYDHAKKVDGVDHISGQYFVRGGQFGGGQMTVQRGIKSNATKVPIAPATLASADRTLSTSARSREYPACSRIAKSPTNAIAYRKQAKNRA